MNLYRFECTVFVRGSTAEEAEQHLADEVKYHFGMDNQLVAIDWSDPELDWSEPENAEE